MRTLVLTCKQFTAIAYDYLDGGLPAHVRVQAWFHLSWCSPCRAFVRQLQQTAAALSHLPLEAPSQGVKIRLLARFRQLYGSRADAERSQFEDRMASGKRLEEEDL